MPPEVGLAALAGCAGTSRFRFSSFGPLSLLAFPAKAEGSSGQGWQLRCLLQITRGHPSPAQRKPSGLPQRQVLWGGAAFRWSLRDEGPFLAYKSSGKRRRGGGAESALGFIAALSFCVNWGTDLHLGEPIRAPPPKGLRQPSPPPILRPPIAQGWAHGLCRGERETCFQNAGGCLLGSVRHFHHGAKTVFRKASLRKKPPNGPPVEPNHQLPAGFANKGGVDPLKEPRQTPYLFLSSAGQGLGSGS